MILIATKLRWCIDINWYFKKLLNYLLESLLSFNIGPFFAWFLMQNIITIVFISQSFMFLKLFYFSNQIALNWLIITKFYSALDLHCFCFLLLFVFIWCSFILLIGTLIKTLFLVNFFHQLLLNFFSSKFTSINL